MTAAGGGGGLTETDLLVRRLRFRLRALGTRELADLLSGFFREEGESLPPAELRLLARLLDAHSDPELLDFVTGAAAWPGWAAPVSARIDSYLQTRRRGR